MRIEGGRCTKHRSRLEASQSAGHLGGFAASYPSTSAIMRRLAPESSAMLEFLLANKLAVGQALGLIAATVTVIVFENVLGWGWYVAIPVAVLAFVSMPVLLIAVLDSFTRKGRR